MKFCIRAPSVRSYIRHARYAERADWGTSFLAQVRLMSADLSREMCNTTLGPPKDSEVIFADLARGGQNSYLAVLLTRGADGSTHTCRWRVNSAADRGGNFSMSKARWDPLQAPAAPSTGHGDSKAAPKALLTCALHRPPPHSSAQPTLSVVWESLAWQRFRIGTGTSPTLETTFYLSGVQSAPRLSPPRSAARGPYKFSHLRKSDLK